MKAYPDPFIEQRADPYVVRASDGTYYFTASYPAFGSVLEGYDRIILRKSNTVRGLATAQEKVIWYAHPQGTMARHIWAPELHYIGKSWYIFFAAGDSDNIWNIRPYVLRCKGSDPYNDPWEEKGRVQPLESDSLSFSGFSLDMTWFEHKGEHYLIWAQSVGDSSLLMAKTSEAEPWRLTSEPIILTKPEYAWEKIRYRVNEGASVLKTRDKIYVFFSASGTGSEYCMGRLEAASDSELMDISSWKKLPEPVLSTQMLENQSGPGHNSFVYDENGELLIIYHARPVAHLEKQCGSFCEDPLYDPCRHARIRRVGFNESGEPML